MRKMRPKDLMFSHILTKIIFDTKVQNKMPNTWSREFGELINTQRKEKKLPLRKVAAALDIDTSTLSKIEKGERPANSKMIPVIAELFGLDFKKLQIRYLSQTLQAEFAKEPFFVDAIRDIHSKIKK
jgi:transcriptional regulator with XRE-family HTH domain